MIIKRLINNSITAVIIISMLGSVLIGCSLPDSASVDDIKKLFAGTETGDNKTRPSENSTSTITVYDTDGSEITSTESVINMLEEEDSEAESISAAELVSENKDFLSDNSCCYTYSKLNDEEQRVYNEIYVVLEKLEKNAELSTVSKDVVDRCLKCVLADHPEIFYVSGYAISKYYLKDEIKKITFTGKYTMDKAEVEEKKPLIEAYTEKALGGLPASASDYDKIKYVYEYLINNNEYNLASANNQNILSVVENGVTVCQGYAKMTQLLLNRMGVFCILVNGSAKSEALQDEDGTIYDNSRKVDDYLEAEEPEADTYEDGWVAHVWNIVMADGEYYNVDTTWGDASFLFADPDGEDYVEGPDLNYDYLMVPDSEMEGSHIATPLVDIPACTSMEDNYYVREGLYFTGINEEQFQAVFDKAYADGELFVTFKCSDEKCYEDIRDFLFKKEKIFKYLTGSSVRYVEYVGRCAMTIYL